MNYSIKIMPYTERVAMIKKRYGESNDYGEPIHEFRGQVHKPNLIILPIDVPVYRMENCRAFSAQQTEIARQGLDKNFFAKGQEVHAAQNAQHKILAQLAREGSSSVTPIYHVLQEDGQREEILISSSGLVVNGNRRLSAMRELLHQNDGSVDKRFEFVRCAVLPPDTDRDEIDDIEADLQARRETKLDYDWIGDARLVQRQVNKGRSTKEVAIRLRRNKSEIENVLQALDEVDLYLSEWLNKPGEYVLVQDGEQLFCDIPKQIGKHDSKLKDASRVIAWSIFENRDKISGRVYRLNRAFGDLAPKTLELLEKRLNLTTDSEDNKDVDDEIADFDIEIDIEDTNASTNHRAIIQALRDNNRKDEKIEALIDACETSLELDKNINNEQAALKALGLVNSKVASIDASSAGEATLPAILNQIKTIRRSLDQIETEVNARLPNRSKVKVNEDQRP